MLTWHSTSPAATQRLGTRLGKLLPPGLIIALNGELGSGKTLLVRSVCEGLGIDTSSVNSPTFVLMQVYTDGRIPVCHFDTYRLGDADEFLAIGADEYLADESVVCLIEWAEIVAPVLPADRLTIAIRQTGAESRELQFHSGGPKSASVVNRLKESVDG